MKKLFFPLVLLLLVSAGASAQQLHICDSLPSRAAGSATVYADSALHKYIYPEPVLKRVEEEEEEEGMAGYRIQIYGGSNRAEAQRIVREMQTYYPEVAAYFTYESPYFKVRIGDFRNKIDAQKWLHILKERYKSVLLVPDKVNFPELKSTY